MPESFTWDGRADSGAAAADGEYFIDLEVVYRNGNTPRVTLGPLLRRHGRADRGRERRLHAVLPRRRRPPRHYHDPPAVERRGPVGRRDPRVRRRVVASRYWKGAVADLVWDGKDEKGRPVPDGPYSYSVSAVDRAQNRGSGRLDGIRVDTRPTPVGLTRGPRLLAQRDGAAREMTLNLYVDVSDGIASWGLTIRDSAGGAVARSLARRGRGTRPAGPRRLGRPHRRRGALLPTAPTPRSCRSAYEKGNLMLARTPAAFELDRIAARRSRERALHAVLARRRRQARHAAGAAAVERRGALGGPRAGRRRSRRGDPLVEGRGYGLRLGRDRRCGQAGARRHLHLRGLGHGRRRQQRQRAHRRHPNRHAADAVTLAVGRAGASRPTATAAPTSSA